MRRNEFGFSLFEIAGLLLVLLAITAATIPSFNDILLTHKLSSVTQNISLQLQTARERAVKENRSISVLFRIKRYGIDIDDNGVLDKNEEIQVPEGISVTPMMTVTFTPRGDLLPGSVTGSIFVSNGEETKSINFMRSGKFTIN